MTIPSREFDVKGKTEGRTEQAQKTMQGRLSEKKEKSKKRGQPKKVCEKGPDARQSQKPLEKSFAARIVQDPGLNWLNPLEMD